MVRMNKKLNHDNFSSVTLAFKPLGSGNNIIGVITAGGAHVHAFIRTDVLHSSVVGCLKKTKMYHSFPLGVHSIVRIAINLQSIVALLRHVLIVLINFSIINFNLKFSKPNLPLPNTNSIYGPQY